LQRNTSRYQSQSVEEIAVLLAEFERGVRNFLFKVKKYPQDLTYDICGLSVIEIIVRVDKRIAYFHYFHGMKINECKLASLYVYWILKLHPIRILDKRFRNIAGHNNVNEEFAMLFLLSALKATGRCMDGIIDNTQYLKELLYSFRFRNFTIDSLLVLADSVGV
jgi:hypothetical protein